MSKKSQIQYKIIGYDKETEMVEVFLSKTILSIPISQIPKKNKVVVNTVLLKQLIGEDLYNYLKSKKVIIKYLEEVNNNYTDLLFTEYLNLINDETISKNPFIVMFKYLKNCKIYGTEFWEKTLCGGSK